MQGSKDSRKQIIKFPLWFKAMFFIQWLTVLYIAFDNYHFISEVNKILWYLGYFIYQIFN